MAPQASAAAATSEGRLPLDAYVAHGMRGGMVWTPLRELVLGLLWGAGAPLGAYQAAARLSRSGRTVHPTSVYRCFSCLEAAGLVLPIVSWNRYLLSPDPAVRWWGLLLCRRCRSSTPFALAAEREALERNLCARGFLANRYTAEIQGRCRRCQAAE